MDKKEVKLRIAKLRKTIDYHRHLYHVLDRQEISPEILDSLKHELYKLEQQFPDLITPDSPTQRIAGLSLEKFKKIFHKTPMLSLEDVFDKEELYNWEKYLARLEPQKTFEYFCELKIDGFAVALVYEKGNFVCGATRGDGKTGEDVTQNLKTIESIPLKLFPFGGEISQALKNQVEDLIKDSRIEIRGEVYMDNSIFEKVNRERRKNNEPAYANPRNLAAGSIRQLDPQFAAKRRLKFLAYGIATEHGQKKHSEEHQILSCLGFRTDKGTICRNLDEVIRFWDKAFQKRPKLPFQIDGVVVVINDNNLFDKLGVAGKSPRGARALKFPSQKTTTKIKDIKVQVGRTGAITPVAVLEPIRIGGAMVTKATLHNQDEIERLDARIGDTAIIERAGDVIPAVSGILKELRQGNEKKFIMPKLCPACKSELLRPKNEVVLRCPNQRCSQKLGKLLSHFASKKAFNINGLGEKIIDRLIEGNLIQDSADIFNLKEDDLLSLDGFAQKSAKNLIESIQKTKKISFARFIYALGIRHIGEETAVDLANFFGNLENLKKAGIEELSRIHDVGQAMAKSVYDWFRNQENLNLLEKLLKNKIEIFNIPKPKNILSKKRFVVTGTLETMTRQEAHQRVRFLGGEISHEINKGVDFLVVGQNPGSKLDKAKILGVKIISEKEFLSIIHFKEK